ncbi:MAG: hypothetical protein ACYTG6_15560, partial [Planctomycetota bacterium]
EEGQEHRAPGRFIRIYRSVEETDEATGEEVMRWVLTFDFADIPMAVGCEPGSVVCPPPGTGIEPDTTTPPPPPPPPFPPSSEPAKIGYADVQQYFRDLGKRSTSAPHENFWELPHAKFVSLAFPDWDEGGTIRMLIPGNSRDSNLVKALRDGRGIVVDLEGGGTVIKDIARMPKGADPMPEDRILAIAQWIDAGAPEFAGGEAPPPTPDLPKSPVGYEQVQALIRMLGKSASSAPHENFWELPYEEFVNLRFPDWDAGGTIRLLVPGNAAESNLIRGLRDGRGIVVDLDGGGTLVKDITRMPKGADPMDEDDLALIAAWIDAGAPETKDGPPAGGGEPPPAPPPVPPPSVPPAPPPVPPPSVPPPAPPDGVLSYARVQQIFRDIGKSGMSAGHENFWDLSRDAFVDLNFPDWDEGGTIRMLIPGNSRDSNLIKALRDGRNIVVDLDDGTTIVKNIDRMPKGATFLSDEVIDQLAAWIDAGCPE